MTSRHEAQRQRLAAQAPLQAEKGVQSVFISYAAPDRVAAHRVYEWLVEQGVERILIDVHSIREGDHFEDRLAEFIRGARAVVIVISPAWLASPVCLREFEVARRVGAALIPVVVRSVDPRSLPSSLQGVAVTNWAVEWERHRLRARLAQLGLSQEYFPYVQGSSPYPGLAGFEEEDAAVFFGRSAQIAEAMARLRLYREDGGCHLIAILGASGSGKSSFLRAELWPRLRRDRASFFCLPILPPREWRGAGGGLDIGHAVHVGIDSDSALPGTFGRVAIQASTTIQ